ncbi:MAG: hypothetical protein DRH56_05345 [Deltaproteobacteria bacterium]|nr:MAG: hypothetical protein DRH56_05345 [Deltaproteobacteria bacterium]
MFEDLLFYKMVWYEVTAQYLGGSTVNLPFFFLSYYGTSLVTIINNANLIFLFLIMLNYYAYFLNMEKFINFSRFP